MIRSGTALAFYRVTSNTKLTHKIVSYLSNNDIISLSCSSKLMSLILSQDKIFLKNLTKTSHKSLGHVLFDRECIFDLYNRDVLEEMYLSSDLVHNNFYNESTRLMLVFVFLVVVLAVDVFSLLLAFLVEKKYSLLKGDHWIALAPVTTSWILSIFIWITFRIKIKRRELSIDKIIILNTKQIRCYNPSNKNKIKARMSLRMKHKRNVLFEKFLVSYILFYFPIFARYHFITPNSNQVTFQLSSTLIFGWIYFSDIIEFIRTKIKNSVIKLNNYKNLFRNKPNVFCAKMQMICHRSRSSQCGEKCINFSFYIVKFFIYFLFILYCRTIGTKLDGLETVTWVYIFIPIYLIQLPVFIYVLMHCYQLAGVMKNKCTVLVSMLVLSIGLSLNTIMIPLVLEGIVQLNAFFIPINFAICSVALWVHYKSIKRVDFGLMR